jgi:hypothetical protein
MFAAEEDGDGSGMLGVGRSRGLDAVRQLHRVLQARHFDPWCIPPQFSPPM